MSSSFIDGETNRYRDDPVAHSRSEDSAAQAEADSASATSLNDKKESGSTSGQETLKVESSSAPEDRKRWRRLRHGTKNKLKTIGTTLQKVNVAKWIDNLEQDQELAYELEDINQEIQEECERKEMMREAATACMDAIVEHLHEFLKEHPQGTYEEWIADLHPENAEEGKLLEGMDKTLDHRFYVEESDHRKLWNENLMLFLENDNGEAQLPPRRHVPAKTAIGSHNTKSLDEIFMRNGSDDDPEEGDNTEEVYDLIGLDTAQDNNDDGKESTTTLESNDSDNKITKGDLIVFD